MRRSIITRDRGPAPVSLDPNYPPAAACDEAIVERTDEITALLLGALGRAITERRHTWLQHYGWFTDLVIELLEDEPGKPLDG